MLSFTLNSLFAPLTRSEFLEKYIAGEPVVIHDQEGVKSLKKLPFLKSVDGLFENWPTEVNAYLKGTADEVNSATFSPEEAHELFKEQGSGIFFDDPNRFDETIDAHLQSLLQDLGLSNLTYARSLIYLIAAGKGTDPHFDQNINFIIQITGEKKWWISPNTTVENPLTRHTIGHGPDSELESYTYEDFPTEMPTEGMIEITMKPGSVLFLPRGVWHKTHAETEALSLNFTFTAPSWADIMTTALRSRLLQSPHWRETANFVNDPHFQTHAIAEFDQLIQQLIEDTPNWRAEDILGATESKL